jgi:group I intron endonuclease
MIEQIYGFIYGLQSPSGKWYIGQTTKDPIDYIRSNYEVALGFRRPKLKRAINKYGFSNFKVALICAAFSKEELDNKEIKYIQEYNCLGNNGYNCRLGGNQAGNHSDETKSNISKSKKGKYTGLNNHFAKKRRIQNIVTGEILEGCLSQLGKKYGFNNSYIVKTGQDKNFKLLDEQPKIIVAKKGTKEFNLKKKLNGMKCAKIITIKNIDTGEEYTGALRELAREYGIRRRTIQKYRPSNNFIKVDTTTPTNNKEENK